MMFTHAQIAIGLVGSRNLAVDFPIYELGVIVALFAGPLEGLEPCLIADMVTDEVESSNI